MKTVSTMDVRARIGDMLDRVALRHDEFVIERRGKPLAALVPVERLEQIRAFARQHGLKFLEQQRAKGAKLSDADAMRLALSAQKHVRARRRSPQRARRPR